MHYLLCTGPHSRLEWGQHNSTTESQGSLEWYGVRDEEGVVAMDDSAVCCMNIAKWFETLETSIATQPKH